MPYNGTVSLADMAALATQRAQQLRDAVADAKEARDKWISVRNGRTDAQMLAAFPATSSAQLADINLIFSVFDEVNTQFNGGTVPVYDRAGACRIFT